MYSKDPIFKSLMRRTVLGAEGPKSGEMSSPAKNLQFGKIQAHVSTGMI